MIFYFINSPDRRLTRFNLHLVFGEKSKKMHFARITRNSFIKLVRSLAETFFAPSTSEKILKSVNAEEGLTKIKNGLEKGKGVIVLTAHLGNPGLFCYVVATLEASYCLARYQRIFQPLMNKHRAKRNITTVLERKTSYNELLAILKENKILLTTLDRALHRKGLYVDLLGLPAHTPYFAVDLARLSGAPIFVAFLIKIGKRYQLLCNEPIYVPQDSDEFESRLEYTQKISNLIGDCIRRYPDEWYWGYRRWRTDLGIDKYPEYTAKRYPSLKNPYLDFDRD